MFRLPKKLYRAFFKRRKEKTLKEVCPVCHYPLDITEQGLCSNCGEIIL